MSMWWRARIAWPTKNAMRTAGSMSANVTAPKTPAFAHSTGSRFGTARERGADHPGRVLAGDDEHAEHADRELRELHADEVDLERVEVGACRAALICG